MPRILPAREVSVRSGVSASSVLFHGVLVGSHAYISKHAGTVHYMLPQTARPCLRQTKATASVHCAWSRCSGLRGVDYCLCDGGCEVELWLRVFLLLAARSVLVCCLFASYTVVSVSDFTVAVLLLNLNRRNKECW